MNRQIMYCKPVTTPLVCILLLISPLILVGCDSSGSADASDSGPSDPLIPLVEGNTWTATSDASDEPVQLRVGGTASVDGASYRLILATSGTAAVTGARTTAGDTLFVQERSDGIYIGAPDFSRDGLEGFLLRYPISGGDDYTYANEEGDTFDVTVMERSTTVPAGTFDSIQYRILDQAADNADEREGITIIAAPGVGPLQLSSAQNTVRLTSFDLQ